MEELRKELNEVIEKCGLESLEALKISQLLDLEVVKEQQKLSRRRA